MVLRRTPKESTTTTEKAVNALNIFSSFVAIFEAAKLSLVDQKLR